MKYVITYTSLAVDADSPEEALDYHLNGGDRGGGNWEAVPFDAPAIDTLDAEYLLGCYVQRLSAKKNGAHEDAAYFLGRIEEYVAQNAIDKAELATLRERASTLVYGDGPKEGLQS